MPVPLRVVVESLIRRREESTVDKVDNALYAFGKGTRAPSATVEQMHNGLIRLSNADNEDVGGLSEVDVVVP